MNVQQPQSKRRPDRRVVRASATALVLTLAFVLASFIQAGRTRVSAQLSTGVARFGERVRLIVTAENARQAQLLELPKVEGLDLSLQGPPAMERGSNFVNGRSTSWQHWRWTILVRPLSSGDFEIPPLELDADGARYSTKSVSLQVVEDLRGADLGFLEIEAQPERVVEGQPFSVVLRFGWYERVEVDFANLSLPWWDQLPGALELESPEPPPGTRLITGVQINDRESVSVEELESRSIDGRAFRQMRLVKSLLPSRSGTLEFSTSVLEFGEFVERRSVFSSRVAKGKSFFVPQPAFTLEVVPLPEEGRPFEFSGAVGTIHASASVDQRDIRVGDSVKLTVDWTGAGNLEFFAAPDLARDDAFAGFRVYGRTEEKSFDRRRVVYDLAALDDTIDAIPPVLLSVFDPVDAAYETVRTEAIPLRVRPLEGAVELDVPEAKRFELDIEDIDATPLTTGAEGRLTAPSDLALLGLACGLPLAWLGAHVAVRRRRGDPDAPLERRRRRARRELERRLARSEDPVAIYTAFTGFLAARTREPDEAWLGRRVRDWEAEQTAALDDSVRDELDSLLARLDRAAWADGPRVEPDELRASARRLSRGGL